MGDTICQLCGYKGVENALVFCVKCLDFSIHRYCLPMIPAAFTEYVRWFCEDCEEKFGKPDPPKVPFYFPSVKEDLITSRKAPSMYLRAKPKKMKHIKSINNCSQLEINLEVATEKENSRLVKAADEERHGIILRHHRVINEISGSEKIIHNSPPNKAKKKRSKSRKKKMSVKPVNVATELEGQKGQNCQSQELCEENNEKLVSDGGEMRQTVGSPNVLEASDQVLAQPVIDPIWRGSFNIETDGYGLCNGLVAHISSKACSKVWEEAELFSESILMELVEKDSVWPKSFQNSEPNDDSIALYFFPINERYIEDFDELVCEMMTKELALRAVVTNAVLLLFTSNELPLSFWKLKDKFYLWGVFKGKPAALSCSTNCQYNIQSMEIDEYNSTVLNATSPISPLSNISNSGLRWTPPGADELKLNIDASVITDTKQTAIGGIFRDKNGKWVHGYNMYLGPINPEKAELCAIFQGLEIARRMGIRKLTLESDSEKAIEAVTGARSDHPLYYIIDTIRDFIDKDCLCRINLINREANSCANRLTREAFSSLSLTTKEFKEVPEFMSSYLASDFQTGYDGKSCDVV